MKKDTVCIVGSNPATRDNAPWDDDSLDIWVLNEAGSKGWAKRYDAVFQLHVPEIYSNPTNVSDNGHWDWLQQDQSIPIYLQDVDERVPNSVRYPLDEIREALPGAALIGEDEITDGCELTSSFPYAIAFAIYSGYKHIKIIGVEMASGTEYQYQREGVKFWTAYALGKGLTVEYYSGHSMWPALLYAYDGREITIPVEYYDERKENYQLVFDTKERQHKFIKQKLLTAVQDGKPERVIKMFMERRDFAVGQGEIAGRLGVVDTYTETLRNILDVTQHAPFDRQALEIQAAKAGMGGEEARDYMNHAAGKAEYVFNVWKAHRTPEAEHQLLALMEECVKHCYTLGAKKGGMLENQEMMLILDEKMQAAGGAKSVQVLGGRLV